MSNLADLLHRAVEQYKKNSMELHESELLHMITTISTSVVRTQSPRSNERFTARGTVTTTTFRVLGEDQLVITEEVGADTQIDRLYLKNLAPSPEKEQLQKYLDDLILEYEKRIVTYWGVRIDEFSKAELIAIIHDMDSRNHRSTF